MSTKDEPPVEQFKRATAACFRAMADKSDLEVAYSAEPPGISGDRVRLPFPSRDLPPEEVAQVRGEADALALRQAARQPHARGRFCASDF
jgi:cobaltochelatase CobT